MEEIRGSARRHCGREDRETCGAGARHRAENLNQSHHGAQYQAIRRNASTRKAAHQDRIPRRKLVQYNAAHEHYSSRGLTQICGSALETESQLRVDAAIVSRIAATEPAKAPGGRRRFPKERRSQITDWIAEVRVIQHVVEVQ